MAMKFWFGKKETAQDGGDSAASDILPKPGSGADSGSFAAVTGQAETAPQSISPAVAPSDVTASLPSVATGARSVPVTSDGVVQDSAVSTAMTPSVDQKRQGTVVSADGAPATTGPVALKAVSGGGNPLRLSVRPVGTLAAVHPAADSQATGRAVFGLRPKGGATAPAVETGRPAVSSEGSSESADQKKPVAANDYSMVRPKTDQRALYYELMNGLYDAILILDEHGHVVDCSKRVSDLLGYSREDAWDLPIEKIITGMSSQMFAHLKRNLAENHHILIDARCFRQDGTSFAGEVGVSTLSLTRGDNIVFAIRNVERRKNAMDDLRKCQAALEVALAPAFVCDTDGFFQVVNQALLESFGIPDAAQSKSVRFVDLLPDAARAFLRAACGAKVREKMTVSTPDGSPLKLEFSLAPVLNGTNITGVSGSILQL